jgi:hypothetical protein
MRVGNQRVKREKNINTMSQLHAETLLDSKIGQDFPESLII